MSALSELIDRLPTEDIYLLYEIERIAIRSDHKTHKFYAMPPGGGEYQIDQSTKLVCNALMGGIEITAAQYYRN